MEKEMICISCPIGCRLTVSWSSDETISVAGNKCPKGNEYAREEVLSPRRIVTAVVKTNSQSLPYAPVKTDKPIPKDRINPLLNKLYSLEVKLPIRTGNTVIENFDNTGTNVVFTRNSET